MDQWPASTVQRPEHTKKSDAGDTKGEELDTSRPYPLVEQGTVTAANLVQRGKRLEWRFLAQNDSGRRLRARGPPKQIFPATYPKTFNASNLSLKQKTEQGAHFLRTHYPDVDIASDIIQEELAEHARRTSGLQSVDRQAGSKLAFITRPERTRSKHAYLAFPMGPTGRELNISHLSYEKRDLVTFRPNASPVQTFETPIDQIVACPVTTYNNLDGNYLAVRTLGCTKLLNIEWKGSSPDGLTVQPLANFNRSDVDDRHIVDMTPPTLSGSGSVSNLVVNDQGRVFRCLVGSSKSTQVLYTPSHDPSIDGFWRIATTSDENTSLLLSSTRVGLIDLRSSDGGMNLLTRSSDLCTAVEGPGIDRMIRVVTGTELLWIDERFPQNPVLSYKHTRQRDRSLQASTMYFDQGPLTLLMSARNSLITVYDVSSGNSGPVQVNAPAYSVVHRDALDCHFTGNALVRHPSDPDSRGAVLMRLSNRGSIHRLDLHLANHDNVASNNLLTHVWRTEVQDLEESVQHTRQDLGPLSERSFYEVDLEPVYKRIYTLDDKASEKNGEDFQQSLASMRSFWGNLEEPVENFLTTFDIAFRSGNEPSEPSRADFLTETDVNSSRGFRALLGGRLPTEAIAKSAAWHYNIRPTLQKFSPTELGAPESIFAAVGRCNIPLDDYRPGPSMRRETDAQEQLTMDLALSTDIYSPHPINQTDSSGAGWSQEDEAFETMSRATENMTIGVLEPPQIEFGFLRPVVAAENSHYRDEPQEEDGAEQEPLGVRLLLKEWEIGSDPTTYTYHDPYNVAEPAPFKPRVPFKYPDHHLAYPLTQHPQKMPPAIVPAAPMGPPPIVLSQPPRMSYARSQEETRPPPFIGTQPANRPFGEDSQNALMPSTQVLPGPFGGRPTLPKKKPAKKRIGGF